MAGTATVTGGRAQVYIADAGGKPQLIGIFESCEFNQSIGVEAIHVLGAYGPKEITPTSYEAVTLNCSGFKVNGYGAQLVGRFPTIGQLLTLEGITITVMDRQDPSVAILTAEGCVGTTNSGGFNARATSKVRITYTGISAYDENGQNPDTTETTYPS